MAVQLNLVEKNSNNQSGRRRRRTGGLKFGGGIKIRRKNSLYIISLDLIIGQPSVILIMMLLGSLDKILTWDGKKNQFGGVRRGSNGV